MIVDLLHNKIIADTMTESFAKSFEECVIPLLREKYSSTEIVGVQMYEDYISDGFTHGGAWYYPLTVVTEAGVYTEWVTWELDKDSFSGANPYAYIGEGQIDFSLTVNVPAEFEEKLTGRARFCEGGIVKINVETTLPDPAMLSGKYSQTFVDEMARQLTKAVENAMSVEGLAESGLEFSLVFTSGTHMEHISENVTYRRLILNDGASAPRDFWIKWTRLDGAVSYSVSANVDSESILFELGEDVSQKIREKEYRYLIGEGKDRYHNAMGRKNVTEWRDIIKRAVKRGELIKVERAVELSPETAEIERRLADVLGVKEKTAAPAEQNEISVSNEFEQAMQKAREIAMGDEADRKIAEATEETETVEEVEETAEETEEEKEPETETEEPETSDEIVFFEEEEEEEPEELDEIEALYAEDEFSIGEGVTPQTDEEAAELDEITKLALEALQFAKEQEAADEALGEIDFEDEEESDAPVEEDEPLALSLDEDSDEEFEELDDEESYDDGELDDALADVRALEPDGDVEFEVEEEEITADIADEAEEITVDIADESEPESATDADVLTEISVDLSDREDAIRAELEAKIRLEYESLARRRAEEETAKLRREQERMRLENEKLLAEAKREQERLRAEYDKLCEQTRKAEAVKAAQEAVRRAEEEKLRAQIEMQLRAEARERERLAEAARLAIEEQHRLEEEKALADRQREDEARRREEARARAEEKAREEAARAAEAERIRREAEEARAAAEAVMAENTDGKYTYTTKLVRLLFRRSVDPNITKRIHEIIKATIDYYAKDTISLKIRATVPDNQTVCLEFVQIPLEEMELLRNIVQILGNSGIGIAKAFVE